MASKLVLITGASSGIGAAAAKTFSAKGAHVVLLARNEDRLNGVADVVRRAGGKATPYAIDLLDIDATEDVAARIARETGTPDFLINNAGAGSWLPLLKTSAKEAAAMMGVPYLAAFTLTRFFAPGMIARGSGGIAFIASPASYLAWPNASAYIAARHAMAGLAEALRGELKGTGVFVTLVILGTVKTPYWDHNPGSLENMPKTDERFFPVMTPEEAAETIMRAIEEKKSVVVKPALYRALFVLNALFPKTIASQLRRAAKKGQKELS